jgi:acetyltransferase-like isoleucine patch superfamily enzyme
MFASEGLMTRLSYKTIYFSPLGKFISLILNALAFFHRPFMVYGYNNKVSGCYNMNTRISSSVTIIDRQNLNIADHCWIWHHSIIDCSHGVTIGEGSTIGAWSGIFTHSSHISMRLLGRDYIKYDRGERKGYVRGPVVIGKYTGIAASCIIFPNVTIGDGCLVSAGSVVTKSIPDDSIVAGNPAKVIGKTSSLDVDYFDDPIVQKSYYDPAIIQEYLKKKHQTSTSSQRS